MRNLARYYLCIIVANCFIGSVPSIGRAASVSVIYSFKGPPGDGLNPQSPLLNINGALYGTTSFGGPGSGVVYTVTTAGAEKILYEFKGSPDGYALASGQLVALGKSLYGATVLGGPIPSACATELGDFGCGTAFAISEAGVEIFSKPFRGSPDGAQPAGGLILANHAFYGTTTTGGGGRCGNGTTVYGCGTFTAWGHAALTTCCIDLAAGMGSSLKRAWFIPMVCFTA